MKISLPHLLGREGRVGVVDGRVDIVVGGGGGGGELLLQTVGGVKHMVEQVVDHLDPHHHYRKYH